MPEEGRLYLVPTPIGNLADITFRAVETLKLSDKILAEDTRKTAILLRTYNINTPMESYHAHNEHKKTSSIITQLKGGSKISLTSDAGTPGISDPGFFLARACIQENIEVECLPGATAFVPALVNSGLPCDTFVFEGFLPHKKGRQTKLEKLKQEERTIVLYESPHRLLKTLNQIKEVFGSERKISVSRELTKVFEENVRGRINEVVAHFEEGTVKGEFVIIIEGNKIK